MIAAEERMTAFEAAERLFFSHADLTAADWSRRLAEGTLFDADGERVPLSAAVFEELTGLVRQLDAVQALQEAEIAGEAATPGDSRSTNALEVRGRDGCSYVLQDRIGTGGHSIVYRGLQTEPFERPVAIKVLYAAAEEADSDECGGISSLRELKAINKLQHPGVCQVHDAGITPWGQPFLALELIDGPPLHRYLAEAKPAIDERLRLFDELLGIVAYAHGEGVIHRDLKPQNVLVHAGSGRLKLIDFGISGIVRPDETSHTAAGYGTCDYQSPEQAGLTAHSIDGRTDIYSLGCLLFEMLTGERAFARPSATDHVFPLTDMASREAQRAALGERMQTALEGQAACCSIEQQAAFAAVVQRCVATEPAERFSSVGELRIQVEQICAGQSVVSEPARRRAAQWGWRAAAAGGMVAAAASLAMFLQPTFSVPPPGLLPGRAEVAGTTSVASREAAERIYANLIQQADGAVPTFVSAAEETAQHNAWIASLPEQLATVPQAERLHAGLDLAERLLDEDLAPVASALARYFLKGYGLVGGDLRLQARMQTIRLCHVGSNHLQVARREAMTLLDGLRENGLLETTPEGLTLLAKCSGFLLACFGSEGRDSAGALLAPVLGDPEPLFAVDATAASLVMVAGMKLQLATQQPEKALALAATVEQQPSALLGLKERYAFLHQVVVALTRLDRGEEAFERLQAFRLETPEMPVSMQKRLVSTMADIRMQQERYEDAVALLRSPAVQEPPGQSGDAGVTVKMLYDAGRCLLNLGRVEDANTSFRAAADLLPAWKSELRPGLVRNVEAMVARSEAALASVEQSR